MLESSADALKSCVKMHKSNKALFRLLSLQSKATQHAICQIVFQHV
jgi:hypothetical protein